MVKFQTIIEKFGKKGEKTGWTYIEISAAQAKKLKPGEKKSFRVKGKLDSCVIKGVALLPMGNGNFIMALNGDMRKKIKKKQGDELRVELIADTSEFEMNSTFMECLADDKDARIYFNTLPGGHQRYFSKWIDSAKTENTRAKRIAMALNALARKWGYGEMIRNNKGQ